MFRIWSLTLFPHWCYAAHSQCSYICCCSVVLLDGRGRRHRSVPWCREQCCCSLLFLARMWMYWWERAVSLAFTYCQRRTSEELSNEGSISGKRREREQMGLLLADPTRTFCFATFTPFFHPISKQANFNFVVSNDFLIMLFDVLHMLLTKRNYNVRKGRHVYTWKRKLSCVSCIFFFLKELHSCL